MFKFFWGKGSQHSAERLQIQKELFQFQKVFTVEPSSYVLVIHIWFVWLRLCNMVSQASLQLSPGILSSDFYPSQPKLV